MRRAAWWLLTICAFSLPWEHSLEFGEPFGSIARLLGLALLAAFLLALVTEPCARPFSAIHWTTIALFVWFCLSYFWSIDTETTLLKLRGYFQEMMFLFFVWELVRTPRQLRQLFLAIVAGSAVLTLLTLLQFHALQTQGEPDLRAAAFGEDPNDVARLLTLSLPMAALLAPTVRQRWLRSLLMLYLPVALFTTLLTGSRSGMLAAGIASIGSIVLFTMARARALRALLGILPVLAAGLWIALPHTTAERLGSIPEQLSGGSLNERMGIWRLGWRAFEHAPWLGYGAGNFTLAAGMSPADTAHNTPLALLVTGGLVALALALYLALQLLQSAQQLRGILRCSMLTALAVLFLMAMTTSVEESRLTWLLAGIIVSAARLHQQAPEDLQAAFPATSSTLAASTPVAVEAS